jgi:hypothetical protein
MKPTLYQILGVDPKASTQEIEAAYNARIDELKFATLQDPNKLRILQQSKEVLADANRRATYDASIAVRVGPVPDPVEEDPAPISHQQWGKWVAAGAVVIVVGLLWMRHGAAPTSPIRPPPVVAPGEPASPDTPPAASPASAAAPASPSNVAPVSPSNVAPVGTNDVAPARPGNVAPASPANVAPAAAVASPPADAAVSPVVGGWSCDDAITGRSSKYNFQQNGALNIVTFDGQSLDYTYELGGTVLKVTNSEQTRTYVIEELVPRKMILNAGTGGQRVVCKR